MKEGKIDTIFTAIKTEKWNHGQSNVAESEAGKHNKMNSLLQPSEKEGALLAHLFYPTGTFWTLKL